MSTVNRFFEILITQGSGKKPSLDTILAQFDKELDNFQELVQPAPESKPRTPFDSKNLNFEDMYMSRLAARQIFSLLSIMLPLQLQMRRSAKLYDGKFKPTRFEADPTFLKRLETLAHEAGATAVKYVKVPNTAIFKHKGIPYEYAIVFTVEMDKDNMSTRNFL